MNKIKVKVLARISDDVHAAATKGAKKFRSVDDFLREVINFWNTHKK